MDERRLSRPLPGPGGGVWGFFFSKTLVEIGLKIRNTPKPVRGDERDEISDRECQPGLAMDHGGPPRSMRFEFEM